MLLLHLHQVTLSLRCGTLGPQSIDHLPTAWPRVTARACSYESAAASVVGVIGGAAVHGCGVVVAAAGAEVAVERGDLRQSAVRR